MKKLVFSVIISFFCLNLSAQQAKYKWGNISREEMEMKFCAIAPQAEAVVLYDIGDYFFDTHYYMSADEIRSIYEYKIRIKILDDRGLKWAKVSIPYHGFDYYEDVVNIKAITYNLNEKGLLVKSKLKIKDIQTKKSDKGLWVRSFTCPDVKAGSVIEYTYRIASLDFVKLRDWSFQRSIPVLWSEFNLKTPYFFNFAVFSNAMTNLAVNEKEEAYANWRFYNRIINFNAQMIRHAHKNIPAFKKEILMPDSCNQILKAQFYLISAITKPTEFMQINDYYWNRYVGPLFSITTDFNSIHERYNYFNDRIAGYRITRGEDWTGFVKKLSKIPEFGVRLRKYWNCEQLLDSFKRITNEKDRMIAIYNYVKSTLKWNGNYTFLAERKLDAVFESKAGSSGEINILLINLLDRSGIRAKPVLISTTENGELPKDMAFFHRFNHLIVSAEAENKIYLLDAINPLRPFTFLANNDINGEGLCVENKDFSWVKIENPENSTAQIFENYEISADGLLKGAIQSNDYGYLALEKRKQLRIGDKNALISQNYPMFVKIEPESIKIDDANDADQPLVTTLNFTDQSLLDATSTQYSFQPLLINGINKNPLPPGSRKYPIDFKYPKSISREIKISIPQGFEILSIPKDELIIFPSEIITYKVTYKIEANQLIIKTEFELKISSFQPQFNQEIYNFYSKIISKNAEAIIFRKCK